MELDLEYSASEEELPPRAAEWAEPRQRRRRRRTVREQMQHIVALMPHVPPRAGIVDIVCIVCDKECEEFVVLPCLHRACHSCTIEWFLVWPHCYKCRIPVEFQ
jgi:hypothetical protein